MDVSYLWVWVGAGHKSDYFWKGLRRWMAMVGWKKRSRKRTRPKRLTQVIQDPYTIVHETESLLLFKKHFVIENKINLLL